jgi:hypothetical protein
MTALVAALLVFLEPLRFAAEGLAVLPTITYRGASAIAELVVHAAVAALSATAGFALWNRSPDGRRLATIAVLAVTARSIQSLTWSVLPNNTPPGSELLSAAVSIVVSGVCLLVLRRTSRPS